MAIDSKNLVVAAKVYSRGISAPLDASSVYASLSEAQTYAQSPIAYAGQIITVLENNTYVPYILDGNAGAYTLSKVGLDASAVKNYVQVVDTLPATGQEQGVIYINTTDSKGYIWDGTKFTVVFEDVTNEKGESLTEQLAALKAELAKKADLSGATFTGTVTLAADPTQNLEAATKQYVDRLVAGINDFTVGVVDSTHPLPAADYTVGQTFRVAEAGTYAGYECETGDLIIVIKDYEADSASNSDFLVVQANIDGAVTGPDASTDANIVIFDGTTGRKIADSTVTIASVKDTIAKAHEHANKTVLDSYTKTETELLAAAASDVDGKLALKADASKVYTKGEVDTKVSTINATIDTLTQNVNTKVTAADVATQINERIGAIEETTTVKAYIDNAIGTGGTTSAEAIAQAKKEAIEVSKAYTDSALTITEF